MYFQNIESLSIKNSDQLLQLAVCCTKQDVILIINSVSNMWTGWKTLIIRENCKKLLHLM